MPRLLLLRHAKSSWTDPGTRDHDRPLNERGRRAAPRIGAYLRDAGLVPDLVLCSSAARTCETVARLDLPDSVAVEVTHDLYLAHPDTVVDLVRAVDDAVGTLMVVGHNPTTHEVALDLAGDGDPDALARLGQKYPTGALAVLAVDGPWRSVAPGGATLEQLVSPRDLEP
ncbi:MAG: histidine phosphatase family protein [Acidimicrobiia bacterium]|jgi:phosphohistidine phosphatase